MVVLFINFYLHPKNANRCKQQFSQEIKIILSSNVWGYLGRFGSKFLTNKKTLNTTKITISQKIPFFNILNSYKKSLKLPTH